MLKNILNLEGVSELNKKEQQSVIAGHCSSCPGAAFHACVASCSGTCSPNGTCYQMLH
ncbi:hypothetical protein [uncultured Aquimarina sp.]|uniref:hypothetical protein n=1 Tax=uncultured Aquimarina sp. TaxID=575652 RepID=UPI002612124D|nr:hypothetical protein [uncultured Aquimarina sp.]